MADMLTGAFCEPPDEVLQEQWNVFRSLAQRRNGDWKDIQSVEEILAESSRGDGGGMRRFNAVVTIVLSIYNCFGPLLTYIE